MNEQPLNILHVEDNPDDQLLLAAFLEEVPDHGFRLSHVDCIEDALDSLAKNQPDAVLLDLNLPDSYGVESFKSIHDRYPDLPIIVMTVLDLQDIAVDTVRAGAQDYLIKGQLSGALVVRSIRYAVERNKVKAELAGQKDRLELEVEKRTADLTLSNKILVEEIQERKRVQRDLDQSRHTLRMVADNTPALLAFVDSDRRYRFINKEYERVFNIPLREILGKTVREVVTDGHYDSHVKKHVETALSGNPTNFEVPFTSPITGKEHWYLIKFVPSRNADDELDGYFVLANDITQARQDKEKILEQHKLLQDIVDGMEAAVFFVDVEDLKITRVNPVAERLLGVERDKLIGYKCYEYLCMRGKTRPEKGCPVIGKKTLHTEFLLERPDQTTVPVTKTVVPVTIDGRPHHVAILFDITRRKEIERQLAYAQKLESIGHLASGVAHEINTPIQYVLSNIQYLVHSYSHILNTLKTYRKAIEQCADIPTRERNQVAAMQQSDAIDLDSLLKEIPEALADTMTGVNRVATIVKAMKKFSHPDLDSCLNVDVNEAIETTVVVARNEWKYVAKVQMDLGENLPEIHVPPGNLNQALLNVLINAAQAIKEHTGREAPFGMIRIRSYLENGSIVISIADDGCGIPECNRDKVFDPFFTTKEVGKGTGQGLAITHSIIDKIGGTIDFSSTAGSGTTFFIRLPVGTRQ